MDLKKTWDMALLACVLSETASEQKSSLESEISWNAHPMGGSLVLRLMETHRKLNDIQTVSVMRCALSSILDSQLSQEQLSEYDSLLLPYADFLYRSGEFIKRAEVVKFLFQKARGRSMSWNFGHRWTKQVEDEFSGVCGECQTVIPAQKSVCTECKSSRKKMMWCGVCRMPVRGLGMSCVLCGHGGHMKHMLQWFKKNDGCPIGCDCNCKFC